MCACAYAYETLAIKLRLTKQNNSQEKWIGLREVVAMKHFLFNRHFSLDAAPLATVDVDTPSKSGKRNNKIVQQYN